MAGSGLPWGVSGKEHHPPVGLARLLRGDPVDGERWTVDGMVTEATEVEEGLMTDG